MTRLAAVPLVLGGLEILTSRELGAGGLLDWRVVATARPAGAVERALRARPVRGLLMAPGARVLAGAQAAAGLALLAVPRSALLCGACLALHLLLLRRHPFSVEGSDDMLAVLLGAATLRSLSADPLVQDAAAVFVAGQVCLAYLTSGLSKAQSSQWWSGRGLPLTLSTRYFGHPAAARALTGHRWLAVGLSWFTIGWESTFVAALFLPPPVALAVVGAGLLFHLACAVTLSLSAFVWAFAATYPCFLYTNAMVNDHLSAAPLFGSAVLAGVVTTGALLGRRTARPTGKGAQDRQLKVDARASST
jgi:hypothetical protein